MSVSEKRLNAQQSLLVTAARKAVDEDRPIDALSLLERISGYWSQNMITIMSIFCSHPTSDLRRWAQDLFIKHLDRCTRATDLLPAALWVRNPKREAWLPREFIRAIDEKRKVLEPDWDGSWNNKGYEGSRVTLTLVKDKQPWEVFDPDLCLTAASQSPDWESWLTRYRALGGSTEDHRYLKIRIAIAVRRWERPSSELKKMLRLYSEVAPIHEARKFLRNITPIRKSLGNPRPNFPLCRHALLVYCSCERLNHNIDDWVHIAQSAMYFKLTIIQRIAQRGLGGLERPPLVQQVFDELVAINGHIPVTRSPRNDVGITRNPIWQSVYRLLPIDANARRILISYSKLEAEMA